MANVERLKALRDYLEAHPEKHDQRNWVARWQGTETPSCGTTMCIAGAAVLLAGYEIDWEAAVTVIINRFPGEDDEGNREVPVLVATRLTDGRWIEEVAEEWLGLTLEVKGYLFYAMDNDVALDFLDELIEDYTYAHPGQYA